MAWQTRWLSADFGLGPFAFQNQYEKRLHKDLALADSLTNITEQLDHLSPNVPAKTLDWLCGQCLRARVELEAVRRAHKLVHTKQWRQSQVKLDKLVALLKGFSQFDIEQMLRNAVGSRKGPRVRRKASELNIYLHQLQTLCKWWNRQANWPSWQANYREFVLTADKRLQKLLPMTLNLQTCRAEIIFVAVTAVGLKDTSQEAIARMLRRAKRKPH